MFNIALGFAFLISFLASPGGKVLSAVFEPEAFRAMPPYQGLLASIFANYWLPAIVIYLVLKAIRAERYLRAGLSVHLLFGLPNAVLCLYSALRVLTSTIQGGGATFALVSVAGPFIVYMPYLLGLATLWLVVRSIWLRVQVGPAQVPGHGPALRGVGAILAALMVGPPIAFLGWLYVANMEKIAKSADARRAKAARFQELCETAARIDIYRRVNDAKSVVFSVVGTNATLPMVEKLDFVEVNRGWAHRGKPPYERLSKKPGESVRVQGKLNVNRTEVTEAEAQYDISIKLLESKSDAAMSIYVEETTIRDRRTNESLAVFTAVGERKTVMRGDEPFCPMGFQYAAYQTAVPSYVLGLMDEKTSREFEERLARLKNKVSGSANK